ncbi:Alpha-soluble NSF attachment protein [Porphyridium purpureum]|uniref:Alpha-soluble NSF attachment protein n=1 Tax=Porphyridium purpureum TaxID=35688 RepID=A0A5J4YQF1_PORPP|nr:Alpha-soluble NSF attachment protein [Porphyridium purpureum]|eukprot:POR5750..scf236_6
MADTAGKDEQGAALLAEAEAKLNEGSAVGFLSSWFGGNSEGRKAEEAADLFVRAGNSYKLAKNYRQAGVAYSKGGDAYEKAARLNGLGTFEAGSKHADAAKMFRQAKDSERAASSYRKAAQLHSDGGRFQQAAKMSKELAELEEELGKNASAKTWYARAADLYEGDDMKSQASTCRVKVAELNALEENYDAAAGDFEAVAEYSLSNKMLKFGARDHLLKAGICRLAVGDDIAAVRAVERYGLLDSSFADSREGKFLDALVKAKEDSDLNKFMDAISQFDSVTRLDPWKTSILLRVKNTIRSIEDDLT